MDLFAGAGGLSLGLQMAGFTVLSAVEWDHQAAWTYDLNHESVTLLPADARTVRAPDLRVGKRRIDLVAGGPPCQGFSLKGQRRADHASNPLLGEFLRLVAALRPRAVLIENVVGLKSLSGGYFFDRLVTGLERIPLPGGHYDVEFEVLNAGDFGLPQNRRRLFIVAVEPGRSWSWPTPTSRLGNATLWDAISDLPAETATKDGGVATYPSPPVSEYAERLRGASDQVLNHHTKALRELRLRRLGALSQGQDTRDLPEDLQAGGHPQTKYRRLRADAPSPTLTAHMGKDLSDFIHPHLDRTLTVREAARIQGFPDWFEFMGSQAAQFRQVGNAVPPPLGEALGGKLAESLRARPRRARPSAGRRRALSEA